MTKNLVFETERLNVHFPMGNAGFSVGGAKSFIYALNDIAIKIYENEVLSIVGESGSGKSTLARAILRLEEKRSGVIKYYGKNIDNFNREEKAAFRRNCQMIFQNPYSSLNPRMTIFEILKEPLIVFGERDRRIQERKVSKMLEMVGLEKSVMNRYPHEFSGGQRQRVAIARALILNPKIVIADECVSALDVSIQAQIIELLQELKRELNLTLIFISHDLSVVKYISDRVAVMYLGEIVEEADKRELFANPLHPYTKALLEAVPKITIGSIERKNIILSDDVPSAKNLPSGCKLHTRCPLADLQCKEVSPKYFEVSENHRVLCHFSKKATKF